MTMETVIQTHLSVDCNECKCRNTNTYPQNYLVLA